MRILIVEDDDRISAPVADDLRRQRHVVEVATDGRIGLDFGLSGIYDVILLDVMVPAIDGIAICRRLRADGIRAMILMITARGSVDDKVSALDAGADDYVVKPVALEELSARIRALARRGFEIRDLRLRNGDLVLDAATHEVTVGARVVALTPTEYTILELLLRHPRQVFAKLTLADKIASFERGGGDDSIKTHITNLRRKLRDAGASVDHIATVYGYGYRLNVIA